MSTNQNEHVGAGALPSSNTATNFQIVQHILRELIGITPAGTYCLLCKKTFPTNRWRHHFNENHADISNNFPNRLQDIIGILNYQVQEAKKGDVSIIRCTTSCNAVAVVVYSVTRATSNDITTVSVTIV